MFGMTNNDDKEKAEAWDTSDETIQNFMKKVIEQIVLTGGVVVLGREEYRAQRIKDARRALEIFWEMYDPEVTPTIDEVIAEFEKELDKEVAK